MLTELDQQLTKAAWFSISGDDSNRLYFQFPPKIASESKGGDWVSANVRGDEPVMVFKTSGPRKMTLEWAYIVGERGHDGSVWGPAEIKKNLTVLKTYYAHADDRVVNNINNLVIQYKHWGFGGKNKFTCRLNDISISYSKTIVLPNPSSKNYDGINEAYPLLTRVSIDLYLWTNRGITVRDIKGNDKKGKNDVKDSHLIGLDRLQTRVTPDWA